MKTPRPLRNRKVQLAFGFAILAFLVVGTISYSALNVSTESSRWVQHTHETLEHLSDLFLAMKSVESATRGFALTGQESYLDSYKADILSVEQEIAIVQDLTADNPIQQRQIPLLNNLADQKIHGGDTVIALRRAEDINGAVVFIQSGSGQQIMADFQRVISEMQNEEQRLLALRDADAKRRLIQIKIFIFLGLLLGLVITAAAGWTVQRDISRREIAEQALRDSAQHDFLTGLPNRILLNDRISQAIILAPRHDKKVAVLFLDLDGFKHTNDSLGHSIGDELLQSVAKRLLECVRASDTVSRQGGDEFVVLLSEIERAEDAAITARRILQSVDEAHPIAQHNLHITASIGLSVFPDDGLDMESLIKNADTAMYQAKENGRNGYRFFTPAMAVRAVERQSIEEDLRHAWKQHEFTLHFQPKVNLKTGVITGAEALLRWTHPIRGAIAPGCFIPVAEDCGLILPIGNWVLREACKQASAWIDAGLPLRTIAVNISAMEFRNENFLEGVFAALADARLDPSCLELELTESVLMKRAESAQSILKALRARGVLVAVDDFGTGYSSLSYLRKFPIDALKIDQSFVHQITTAPDQTTIVAAVISMGQSLNLRVVAEGVETHEEMDFLQAHNCDEAQGYYFGRPVPAEEFARVLKTGLSEIILQ